MKHQIEVHCLKNIHSIWALAATAITSIIRLYKIRLQHVSQTPGRLIKVTIIRRLLFAELLLAVNLDPIYYNHFHIAGIQ